MPRYTIDYIETLATLSCSYLFVIILLKFFLKKTTLLPLSKKNGRNVTAGSFMKTLSRKNGVKAIFFSKEESGKIGTDSAGYHPFKNELYLEDGLSLGNSTFMFGVVAHEYGHAMTNKNKFWKIIALVSGIFTSKGLPAIIVYMCISIFMTNKLSGILTHNFFFLFALIMCLPQLIEEFNASMFGFLLIQKVFATSFKQNMYLLAGYTAAYLSYVLLAGINLLTINYVFTLYNLHVTK